MNLELLTQERAVFTDALLFLPKWKVDAVAQFADWLDVYVLHYNPLTDVWYMSCGEHYSTAIILMEVGIHMKPKPSAWELISDTGMTFVFSPVGFPNIEIKIVTAKGESEAWRLLRGIVG